jgi:hypothetical protein
MDGLVGFYRLREDNDKSVMDEDTPPCPACGSETVDPSPVLLKSVKEHLSK